MCQQKQGRRRTQSRKHGCKLIIKVSKCSKNQLCKGLMKREMHLTRVKPQAHNAILMDNTECVAFVCLQENSTGHL